MGTSEDGYDEGSGKRGGPELMFEEGQQQSGANAAALKNDKTIEMFRGENLRKMAVQNLMDRRQRQKQSEIFNQQES